MEECRLGSECFGQTPLVYTEIAVRSRSGKGSGAGREQIQTRKGVRGGRGWRDDGTGLCWRPL